MNLKNIAKRAVLIVLALLACLALASCGKTKKPADIDQFCSACKNDGLTVSSREADDPDGDVIEYAAYGHDQENVLVQYYHFKDEAAANKHFLEACEAAEAGPSAVTYDMTGNNFNSRTITADRAYTVVTQVEDTLVIAAGPLQFKSSLDRILLSIGYLTSNL